MAKIQEVERIMILGWTEQIRKARVQNTHFSSSIGCHLGESGRLNKSGGYGIAELVLKFWLDDEMISNR